MAVSIKQELELVKSNVNNGEGMQNDLAIDEQHLTVEKLKYFLPKGSKVNVTQATVDMVNDVIDKSTVHRGLMEERLLTYTHLLGPGIGMKQLLNAIQFVILSTTPGMTQTKAYMVTFPDKADELIANGKDASSFASMYAKTKLVQEIMTNSQVGLSVTYAPLQHQLIQKLLELSNGRAANGDSASATVQLNATVALIEFIKAPEEQTINLRTGADEATLNATMSLAEQISRMADVQLARLKGGESLNNIQKVGIVTEAEIIDDDYDDNDRFCMRN